MMCRVSISAFLMFIIAAIVSTQHVTSSPFKISDNEITTTDDLENELKQLPTEKTDIIVENGQMQGTLNAEANESVPTIPNFLSDTKITKESEEEDEGVDEDDDEDDEESSEEDTKAITDEITSLNDETTLSVISDFDQMDAAEEDDFYQSNLNLKPPQTVESEVLDEELELEKRMARATNKFLSTGKLDESTVEELVEMLIRFAGDPEQWEKIRQILEKIRYEQITTKKAKARMRALELQSSTSNNQNNDNRKLVKAPIVSEAQNSSQKPIKQNKTLAKNEKQKNLTGLNKSNALKHKHYKNRKTQGNNTSLKMKISNSEPYKYAVEKPVAVVGERSKPIQHSALSSKIKMPLNHSLKAIQLQKSQLLNMSNKPTDLIEEELKTLGQQERRLKEHFERKQKLLQEIREKNAARVENAWNPN